MNNRKELLEQEVAKAGSLIEDDRKELSALMRNPAFVRFLGGLLLESDMAVTMLANQDLTSEQGIRAALSLQAKAKVLSALVDVTLDFICTETQPTHPEEEDIQL